MDNRRISWCKAQKRGINIIPPNPILAEEYFKYAGETLTALKTIGNLSFLWSATMKYYFEYFTVYALLVKIGITSEIHDCTIALCDFLEQKIYFATELL